MVGFLLDGLERGVALLELFVLFLFRGERFTTRWPSRLSSIEAFNSPIWNRWRRNAARSFRFSLMDTTAIKGTQANTTKSAVRWPRTG